MLTFLSERSPTETLVTSSVRRDLESWLVCVLHMLLEQLTVIVRSHCFLIHVHSVGKWDFYYINLFTVFLLISIFYPDLLNNYFAYLIGLE